MDETRDLGIALSGGGHRATAFALGSLLAVVDADLNRNTISVSSVSGGSIANAIAMTGPDFGQATASQFEEHIRPALVAVAERGLLLGGAPATRWYLRFTLGAAALGLVALVASFVVAVLDFTVAALIVLVIGVVLLVIAWVLLRQRSARVSAAIDDELLGGRKRTMSDVANMDSSVHHVMCTTELQSGEPFYFTNRCVWNYRFGGSTSANGVHLADAVQASACVPGAFNPRRIRLADVGLSNLTIQAPGQPSKVIEHVVLDDGGTYDNMADEWEYGFDNRVENFAELRSVQSQRAGYLVVVNASAGWNTPQPIGNSGLALEIAGLMRAQGVQYDVSTAHRRRALYSKFTETGSQVHGVIIQISDNPYRLPQLFSSANAGRIDDRTRRADEAIKFLDDQGYTSAGWDDVVGRTRSVGTTLAPLGVEPTAELLEHGYVLTAVLLYVIDGKGTLSTIDRTRFRALCSTRAA